MIQASFAFSVMSVCVKFASQTLPVFEIVFFRSLIGTLLILAVMRTKKVPLLGVHRKMMAVRGISGFLAVLLFFYTLSQIQVGTAVLLNCTSPIFVPILAFFFLAERPSLFILTIIGMVFGGLHLLIHTAFEGWNHAVLTGILSGFFAAVALIAIRRLKSRESPLTIIFYFTGISTAGSLLLLPFGFRWPDLAEWLFLAGVGIGSFYGQLWLTIALRRTPASVVTPFSFLTPLFSYGWGFVFWQDTLNLKSAAGVFTIITGGILISFLGTQKQKGSKKKSRAASA